MQRRIEPDHGACGRISYVHMDEHGRTWMRGGAVRGVYRRAVWGSTDVWWVCTGGQSGCWTPESTSRRAYPPAAPRGPANNNTIVLNIHTIALNTHTICP
eukprot:1192252-Prorocentrum_minimum.AAC.2